MASDVAATKRQAPTLSTAWDLQGKPAILGSNPGTNDGNAGQPELQVRRTNDSDPIGIQAAAKQRPI